jgi:cytochrome c2
MNRGRVFFALCLVIAVGLIGLVTGSALHPQTMSPQAAAGLEIWRATGCEGCHTLYGIGGNYGPDLTHIVADRGEEYLREFFVNPNAFHPDQRVMPRFNLTRDEVTNVIALLRHAEGEGTDGSVVLDWPPHPIRVSGSGGLDAGVPAVSASSGSSSDPSVALGKTLFGQNCASCHSLERDVKIIGPSLWGIADRGATRVTGQDAAQYIRESVLHPSDYVVEGFPDVMQKNLGEKLSADELDGLLAFLMTYGENRS